MIDIENDTLNIKNINEIILHYNKLHYENKDLNIDPDKEISTLLEKKFNNLSNEKRKELINNMMFYSSKIIKNTESINKLTKNNKDIPFFQLIKFRLQETINFFINQGYKTSNVENSYLLEKGIYNNKLDVSKESILEAFLKEVLKYQDNLKRDFNIINNLFNINKVKITEYLNEKTNDFYIPFYFNHITNISSYSKPSLILNSIIKKDINFVNFLLDNNFTLNLKEYSLMFFLLLKQEDFHNNENNNNDFYNTRQNIINKLNDYPLEYKKELSINIINYIESSHTSLEVDILFSLKDIIIPSFSLFSERNKYEFLFLKRQNVFSLFLELLPKEDKELLLKLTKFNNTDYNYEKILFFKLYDSYINSKIYGKQYIDFFNHKLENLSKEQIKDIIKKFKEEIINNQNVEQQKIYQQLSIIFEQHILKDNISNITLNHNNKKRI